MTCEEIPLNTTRASCVPPRPEEGSPKGSCLTAFWVQAGLPLPHSDQAELEQKQQARRANGGGLGVDRITGLRFIVSFPDAGASCSYGLACRPSSILGKMVRGLEA